MAHKDKKKRSFLEAFKAGFKTKAERAGAKEADPNRVKFGDTAEEAKRRKKKK